MAKDFAQFIRQLSAESRFDRNLLQRIYERQIFSEEQAKSNQYKEKFQEEWDDWAKLRGGTEDVSDFFIIKGDMLFREWLRNFFPFNTGYERLILGFEGGGTPEDVVIHMFYRFSPDELTVIDYSFNNCNIREITRQTAVTRMFLESFLAMRSIISKVVGYEYSLVVEESRYLAKSEGRILYLELVARPS